MPPECQKHPDERSLDVEPIVMIGIGHVFRARDDEMLVVTEPDAVEHKGVEPVHHYPEGIGRQGTAPISLASVDVAHQQTQQNAKHNHGDYLFGIKDRSARAIAGIHQSQLVTPLNDGRRIVEDALDGVPWHQEHEQRENGARDEGFYQKGHL